MLSQTNVHWLAINKLDLLTAHNRCLRIIDLSGLDRLMTQPERNQGTIYAG